MTERDSDTATGLSSPDALAIDALIDARFDVPAAQASGADPARIARAAGLLALLASDAAPNSSLADVTMARVAKVRRQAAAATAEPVLSPDDEAALESWIMHGYDAARVAPSLRERARRHESLAGLVAATGMAAQATPVSAATSADGAPDLRLSPPAPLLDRTLAAIDAYEDETSATLHLPTRRRGVSLRLADLVSAAAVVLVGAGVVLPILSAVREEGRRAMCRDNLGGTATAMSSYAGANRDSLPVTASLGGSWWDVGTPQHSNSANLYTLARDGYVTLATLACPGNPAAPTAPPSPDARDWRRLEEISYSYQIMSGPRPAWKGNHLVVLADRSPVVLRAIHREQIDPFANAPNHRSAGQHLLANDGSVTWAITPILANGDNIWLPRAFEIRIRQTHAPIDPLSGRELPDSADDTFLGP